MSTAITWAITVAGRWACMHIDGDRPHWLADTIENAPALEPAVLLRYAGPLPDPRPGEWWQWRGVLGPEEGPDIGRWHMVQSADHSAALNEHEPGCWDEHPECAVAALRRIQESLRAAPYRIEDPDQLLSDVLDALRREGVE